MPDRGQIIGIKTTAFESYIQKRILFYFEGCVSCGPKSQKKESMNNILWFIFLSDQASTWPLRERWIL